MATLQPSEVVRQVVAEIARIWSEPETAPNSGEFGYINRQTLQGAEVLPILLPRASSSVSNSLSLDDQIVLALRRITRAIDLRSRELMQHYGLTAPQLSTLQAIGRLQPAPAGQIAREIHLGQPTLTGVLNRLERQGLIHRARGQRDRRHIEVRLTDAGVKILQSAPSLLEDKFQRRLGDLKQWEQTQILSTLQRIADMMDAGTLDEQIALTEAPLADAAPAPAPDLHQGTGQPPQGDATMRATPVDNEHDYYP